jgi:hypothetical protein
MRQQAALWPSRLDRQAERGVVRAEANSRPHVVHDVARATSRHAAGVRLDPEFQRGLRRSDRRDWRGRREGLHSAANLGIRRSGRSRGRRHRRRWRRHRGGGRRSSSERRRGSHRRGSGWSRPRRPIRSEPEVEKFDLVGMRRRRRSRRRRRRRSRRRRRRSQFGRRGRSACHHGRSRASEGLTQRDGARPAAEQHLGSDSLEARPFDSSGAVVCVESARRCLVVVLVIIVVVVVHRQRPQPCRCPSYPWARRA